AGLAATLTVPLTGAPAAAAGDVVAVEVLSNRADLMAGGDALVEVTVPDGADASRLTLDVNGRDVTDAFAVRTDGRFLGVVTGLELGDNRLTAELPDGRGAYLDITNHPHGGPVFSGPQIEPWTCDEGADDEQCNREPTYQWHYMPADGGGLESYDPDNPPDDVGQTTTDEGETVPFIVREEIGVIVRDEYRIAVLFDPAQPWEPTEPQDAWNRKLLITHGASCDVTFAQGSAPSVFNDMITGSSPTVALGQGFAVLSHALDNAGHNCNVVTQAESLIATKEYLVDNYGGPIRYTIGTGCSGGSLTQQHVANAYPGVYQGILPQCSFTDSWSSTMQYQDYVLTRRYFEDPTLWGPGVAWAPNQIAAVNGHPNVTNPITFTEVIAPTRDPSRDCPGLDPELVYHHDTNPEGVRCSLQDYMVNVVGRRGPSEWNEIEQMRGEGHGRTPLDNVGIQYGLGGLLDLTILPHQFVDVNAKLGSRDIEYEQQEPRGAADPLTIERAYRSGAANVGNNMDTVAIIDLRGPDPGAFHDVYRTYAMRERLIRERGHADNQLLWRGSVALLGDVNFTAQGLLAMDQWLAAVEVDARDVPLAQKITEDRPETVDHRCTDGDGTDVPAAYCDAVVESYSTPRFEAGMPLTDDTLKCELQPLEDFDYGAVAFTDTEWATLNEVFPDGVCDYAKPGVERAATVAWLDYTDTVGGEPMGPAPTSVPYGPAGAEASPAPVLPATGGGAAAVAIAALALAALVPLVRRNDGRRIVAGDRD
ncbi:MAG TPA: DUF6351 family protein, partial [Nitriliruptorales bacterium]